MRLPDELISLVEDNNFDIMIYQSPNMRFTSCEVMNASVNLGEGVKLKSDYVLMVFLKNRVDYIEFAIDSFEERNGGIAFYNKDSKLFLNYK